MAIEDVSSAISASASGTRKGKGMISGPLEYEAFLGSKFPFSEAGTCGSAEETISALFPVGSTMEMPMGIRESRLALSPIRVMPPAETSCAPSSAPTRTVT